MVTLPIMHIGLRMKRKRPMTPMYLERQPADHKRTVKQLKMHFYNYISERKFFLFCNYDMYYVCFIKKIATGRD